MHVELKYLDGFVNFLLLEQMVAQRVQAAFVDL